MNDKRRNHSIRPIGNFENFSQAITAPETPPSQAWRPFLFHLKPEEKQLFLRFCGERRIEVIDTLRQQLADLARVRFPSPGMSDSRTSYVDERLKAGGGQLAYGTWAYFPWLEKVVHILDEEDYFEVITDRNRLKITREEQQELRTKRVGVIGLSVGAEAAATVAQEHLCGELVIADFDELELSNLNRLTARIDEIGFSKAVIAARRIAGLNPYLKVRLFREGVHESNMDEFLEGLDLLIEECDDLAMKFRIRQAAKARGLNIVFAADERGMLSIEPYQYCEELQEFHGRITSPPPPRESYSEPEEFISGLTEWLGGWDCLSERSQSSVKRIGKSLCGYPQLSGEARLAAGQVAHVARRLLLGERLSPALIHFDLEQFQISSDAC